MLFPNLRREFRILRYLRKLARQRVSMVLRPGDVWVIENAVEPSEEMENILLTCLLRGWVEQHAQNIPHGKLGNLENPSTPMFQSTATVYRLTDSGWNAIHRTHELSILAVLLTIGSVFIGLK